MARRHGPGASPSEPRDGWQPRQGSPCGV